MFLTFALCQTQSVALKRGMPSPIAFLHHWWVFKAHVIQWLQLFLFLLSSSVEITKTQILNDSREGTHKASPIIVNNNL